MRRLKWVGAARRDLKAFPVRVRKRIGYALYAAQEGDRHPHAKSLKGFGGAGVLEVVEDHQGDTFRAVYTVRLQHAVYVLHCFQKKSKHGIATPLHEMRLIAERLKRAQEMDHAETNFETE